MKRFVAAVVNAWILFIGVDFLFHAGIVATIWKEEIPAIKSESDLAVLIPVGYASFLLLVILIGYIFQKIFKERPNTRALWKFALIFGGLFSVSNLLGLYSYVEIPLEQVVLFNVIYFIEIIVVCFSLSYTLFATKFRKMLIWSILLFILLVILGVVFQNVIR